MTATAGRRFWVEVTPRSAVPDAVAGAAPVAVGASGGGASSGVGVGAGSSVPRLTELAVAAGLEGSELDAELVSVNRQIASLAAYRAGLVERKATLGARPVLPFGATSRTDTRPDADPELDPSVQAADDFLPEE